MFQKFNEIPFYDHSSMKGRPIPCLTFYSDDVWHMWLNTNQGFLKFQGSPIEGIYFGTKSELPSDLHFEFFDFLLQHIVNQDMNKALSGISSDIMNLAASLEKISIFYKYNNEDNKISARLVGTEVEYIFIVCRGIFDLLQEIISAIWKTIRFFDNNIQTKLPTKFSKIVINKDRIKSFDEIIKQYNMPEQLVNYYCKYSNFFSDIRYARNNITHHGSSFDRLYITQKGFAIKEDLPPFSNYNIWKDDKKLNNNLYPLRTGLSYIIHNTIQACDDFALTIQSLIKFPPPAAPGFNVFLRSENIRNITDLKNIISNSLWDSE